MKMRKVFLGALIRSEEEKATSEATIGHLLKVLNLFHQDIHEKILMKALKLFSDCTL